MGFVYKLFRQDPNSREGIITTTSVLGILINLLIAGTKMVIGVLASSIAILSEGANNAADAATSLLTIVGAKLAGKHPTKKHPFGFGRIEYLTGLIISVMIVVTGAEFLLSSVKRIFAPEPITVSYLTLIIIAVTAVVKLLFGSYTVKMGQKAESNSLIAVGTEGKSDALTSVITIAATLIYIFFDLNVDAYAGVITSAIIIKAGLSVLGDTLSDILGRPGKEDLAAQLYQEIRANEIVCNAADMMLHNYGPDNYSGSVNIEIDRRKTVEEVYAAIHQLQLEIMHKHHVTMVFGIYAIDTDSPESAAMRQRIAQFVRGYDHVISYHALFISEKEQKIYCDLVVDYELKDWDALRGAFSEMMKQNYPHYDLELVIETEYV